MKIKFTGDLFSVFREVEPVRNIWASVAFIDKEGVDFLHETLNSEYRGRILASLSGYAAEPSALKTLLDLGFEVRVYSSTGYFHPKVYVVNEAKRLEEDILAVVGSSNLTAGGFKRNIEANIVLKGRKIDSPIKEVLNFLKGLWTSPVSQKLTDDLLSLYEDKWQEYKRKAGPLDLIKEKICDELLEAEPSVMDRVTESLSKRNLWLAVTSPENYRECVRLGLWGVERYKKVISQVKPRDLIVFYVKGDKMVKEVYEVYSSMFTSNEKVWTDKTYPYRLLIKPVFTGKEMDFRELAPELEFIKDPEDWGKFLQVEMRKLSRKDSRRIIEKLIKEGTRKST